MTHAKLKLCTDPGPRGPDNGIKLLALALALTFGLCASSVLAKEDKSSDNPVSGAVEKSDADAGPLKGGIIYGKDHAYVLAAPDGWVLDNQAGVNQGVHAVFYPEGGSWSDSKAVMYSRIHDKSEKTLQEVIDKDLSNMSKDSTKFKAVDQETITCTKGAKAHIKFLSGDKFGTFEAVGYIEEPKKVIIIVLTARDEKNFKDSVSAFNDLVKSYFWMTDQVKIEK